MFGVSYLEALVLLFVAALIFKPGDVIKIVNFSRDLYAKILENLELFRRQLSKKEILGDDFEEVADKKDKNSL